MFFGSFSDTSGREIWLVGISPPAISKACRATPVDQKVLTNNVLLETSSGPMGVNATFYQNSQPIEHKISQAILSLSLTGVILNKLKNAHSTG
jgi:hypothetical protein